MRSLFLCAVLFALLWVTVASAGIVADPAPPARGHGHGRSRRARTVGGGGGDAATHGSWRFPNAETVYGPPPEDAVATGGAPGVDGALPIAVRRTGPSRGRRSGHDLARERMRKMNVLVRPREAAGALDVAAPGVAVAKTARRAVLCRNLAPGEDRAECIAEARAGNEQLQDDQAASKIAVATMACVSMLTAFMLLF